MMIDWHSHILPGVDDGPADIEESVAIAEALAAGGFTEVYCTPHQMRGCYETGNDEVRWGVARLQERLYASGIPITLRIGREYCLDEYLQDALEDPLTLGDSRLLLVEILPHSTADMVSRLLYDVVRAGFTPVVAHPERSPCSNRRPPRGQRRHPGGPSQPVPRHGQRSQPARIRRQPPPLLPARARLLLPGEPGELHRLLRRPGEAHRRIDAHRGHLRPLRHRRAYGATGENRPFKSAKTDCRLTDCSQTRL